VPAEAPCFVTFEAFSQTVPEDVGDAVVGLVTSKPSASGIEVSVILEVSSTARNGEDLLFDNPLRVTIPAGATSPTTFTIPIVDDADPESTEQIMLAIEGTSDNAYTGADSEHVIRILDNDAGDDPPPDGQSGASLGVSLRRHGVEDLGIRILDRSRNEVAVLAEPGADGPPGDRPPRARLPAGQYLLELSLDGERTFLGLRVKDGAPGTHR
jgi:hypothetical protein